MSDEIHRILNAIDLNFVPMSLRLSRTPDILAIKRLPPIDLRRAAKLARAPEQIKSKCEFRARGLVVSSFCKHFSKSQTKPISGSMSSSCLLSFRGLTKTSFHKTKPNSSFKYPHDLIMRCRRRRRRRRCKSPRRNHHRRHHCAFEWRSNWSSWSHSHHVRQRQRPWSRRAPPGCCSQKAQSARRRSCADGAGAPAALAAFTHVLKKRWFAAAVCKHV